MNVIAVDVPKLIADTRRVADGRVVRALRVGAAEREVLRSRVAGGGVAVSVVGRDREVVPTPAAGVVVAAASDRLAAVAELTVKRVEVPVTLPWVAVSWVVCASYSVTVTVAPPLVKVVAVAEPKLMAVPDEFFAVGTVALGLLDGPENTRF